jgi:hypothetical protein
MVLQLVKETKRLRLQTSEVTSCIQECKNVKAKIRHKTGQKGPDGE